MVRTNQGGSVLGFIVVGVVLAALFIGGVYLARHQTVAPVAGQSQPPKESPVAQPSTPNKSSDQPSPQPSQTTPSSTSPAASASQLPQTGPTETLGALLGIGFLTSLIVAYYRSRRPELHFDLQ
jgi:LPXTG-motif cell wall-anchored protein